ncbi:aldo/keto reductase [Streptomyces hoynatensis]|uniref:L-glyceraldehyde 3-phosphate reductase n=1 Tax=Streptomyces hoynatensis TaxID=1141874 RepID=A0A3A9YTI3_9ACTN|nr:aldo/keto reductase [Streptomyces hoynatensis]RKN38586.1 L-glyceraldehyde 3-phosphate reductase [Streptomyces hoynatensis]
MTYAPAADRHESMPYRRAGRGGVPFPAVSLGLWHHFGDGTPLATQRAVLRRAFDRGITHFDLSNIDGPPSGAAEANFGTLFAQDFRRHREELFLATKAGFGVWPGPYGGHGSRKHLLASLDRSLRRMRVECVDVFYSHRHDPTTPLEETLGALDAAVRQGKARYAGICGYPAEQHRRAAALLAGLGTPLLLHRSPYNLLNRRLEAGVLAAAEDTGTGLIAFSPLAQGLLTGRCPAGEEAPGTLRALAALAAARGQSLDQLALSWVLRDPRVASVLVAASSVSRLDRSLAALEAAPLTAGELAEIDRLSPPPAAGG